MPFGQEIFGCSSSLRWARVRVWGPVPVEAWAWGAEEGVEWVREQGQGWARAGDAVEDAVVGVVETVSVFSVALPSAADGKWKGSGTPANQGEQFVP